MSNKTNIQLGSSDGGCGCLSLIIFILVVTMIGWGLPTPWGKFNIDIFPPRIWDMDQVEQVETDDQ